MTLSESKIKYTRIDSEWRGGEPTFMNQDTISYIGSPSKRLFKEINKLIQKSEVKNLENRYSCHSHQPSIKLLVYFNGTKKLSYGCNFPRGIDKLISRIYSIDPKYD